MQNSRFNHWQLGARPLDSETPKAKTTRADHWMVRKSHRRMSLFNELFIAVYWVMLRDMFASSSLLVPSSSQTRPFFLGYSKSQPWDPRVPCKKPALPLCCQLLIERNSFSRLTPQLQVLCSGAYQVQFCVSSFSHLEASSKLQHRIRACVKM